MKMRATASDATLRGLSVVALRPFVYGSSFSVLTLPKPLPMLANCKHPLVSIQGDGSAVILRRLPLKSLP